MTLHEEMVAAIDRYVSAVVHREIEKHRRELDAANERRFEQILAQVAALTKAGGLRPLPDPYDPASRWLDGEVPAAERARQQHDAVGAEDADDVAESVAMRATTPE